MANTIATLAFGMLLIGFYADRKLDGVWPYTLSYETEGLKCESDKCELLVWIRNGGWSAQRDVRFELPVLGKEYETIYVSRGYKFLGDTSVKTIDFGVLHSGSSRLVTLNYPITISSSIFFKNYLDIYSADSEAYYAGPGDEAHMLPMWWWVTVFGMLAYLSLLIIVRLFETSEGRYTRLLRELDKEFNIYGKRRKIISRIRQNISETPNNVVESAEARIEKWPRWMRPKSRRGVVQRNSD